MGKIPNLGEGRYLKKKVFKMTNDINKSLNKTEKLTSNSLPLLTTVLSPRQSTKTMTLLDSNNSHISLISNTNRMSDTDQFNISQHHKIVHLESTIQKMIERYNQSQKRALDTASRVLANFEKK
jgi:hypothetical protein